MYRQSHSDVISLNNTFAAILQLKGAGLQFYKQIVIFKYIVWAQKAKKNPALKEISCWVPSDFTIIIHCLQLTPYSPIILILVDLYILNCIENKTQKNHFGQNPRTPKQKLSRPLLINRYPAHLSLASTSVYKLHHRQLS